jgi:hypothetical protein
MPNKTWAVGEEVLAADFNTYVQKQVVAQFVDAAQRTAQLPTPATGQLSTFSVGQKGKIDYWNGGSWLEHAPFTQRGTLTGTTNAAGGIGLTFPATFGSATVCVVATDASSAAGGIIIVGVQAPGANATTVAFICRRTDLASTPPASSISVTINWFAIGAWL